MQEVGSKNNISVDEDEIKNVIMQEARRYPGEEKKVLEFYKKNPEALNAVRGPIYEDKVIDFIIKNSAVSEKKVNSDQLFKETSNKVNKKSNKSKSGHLKGKKLLIKKSGNK